MVLAETILIWIKEHYDVGYVNHHQKYVYARVRPYIGIILYRTKLRIGSICVAYADPELYNKIDRIIKDIGLTE